MKDFSKRLAMKLLIVKGHVPRQYGFSRQRKKIFINKLESLKIGVASNPIIENTWQEQPVVDGSVEEEKRKFPSGVVVWKRTILLSFLQGVSLFVQYLKIFQEAKHKICCHGA